MRQGLFEFRQFVASEKLFQEVPDLKITAGDFLDASSAKAQVKENFEVTEYVSTLNT